MFLGRLKKGFGKQVQYLKHLASVAGGRHNRMSSCNFTIQGET